jgi:dihydrofolate reductase
MRKIIATEFISLDGVVESANEWIGPYFDDAIGREIGATMAGSDALLLGRVTYQEFIPFWAGKTGDDDPTAAHMSKPKYVVSTTLENTDDWRNSTLVTGDVVKHLTRLKEQPGKDIGVTGSVTLVRSLLRDGLLDELSLLQFPIVLGTGKRLFPEGTDRAGLALVRAHVHDTGVLSLTYAPAYAAR